MPPNKLSFSQTEFAASLFNPEARAPTGVVDPAGKPAPKRYSVYKNNVVVSYLEALAAAYPACKNLVGEDFFNAVGRAYLQETPPNSQLMILFGEGFSKFIEGYEPAQQIPFLPDVAKLERAWRLAYHSEDIAPVSPEKLGTLPPEELGNAKIDFLPSVALINSRFPVHALWQAANSMQPLDTIDASQCETVLLVRPDLDVIAHNIHINFGPSIKALLEGQTLNEAAEIGMVTHLDFDFSAMLALLIQSGAVADIKINNKGNE